MAKRKFALSEQQIQELKRAHDECKDGPSRSRYQAVRRYGTGYPAKEVMEIAGCSRTSLMGWCRIYQRWGAQGLIDKRVGGNHARLKESQLEELKARVHTYSPAQLFGKDTATAHGQFWTVRDLAKGIYRWYGVVYQSPSSYFRLLKWCRQSYQRPAKAYKSRSETKLIEFEGALEKK
jgi:transposase